MADTIFALSSGSPPAAIAIIRLSGDAAESTAAVFAGPLPPYRRAGLRTLRDGGDPIDQALVLRFPGGSSATGEPLVEFHLHGGVATVRRMLDALATRPGLRMAEPGEFTRRAVLNGRMSLIEAEALGDLLAARTEMERRWALGAVDGALGTVIDVTRDALLDLSAQAEALIDHADEDDVDPAAERTFRRSLTALSDDVRGVAEGSSIETLRDGPEIVLAGPPNSGKSSLFNALLRRDAALVSPVPGTTRDRIEATIEIDGRRFRLVDTAGLHETQDTVERMGIDRAKASVEAAALLLWLGDEPPDGGRPTLHIRSRCDLAGRQEEDGRLGVSARTGGGLDRLAEQIAILVPGAGEDGFVLTARQRTAVSQVASELASACGNDDLLIAAEHLRLARSALDGVAQPADLEQVLDRVFSSFCLGK